jgi:tetratricopeptide (TPR) repeat protein
VELGEGLGVLAKASPLAVCVCFLAASLAASDPVVIEGVPSIGWGSAKYSHYMAALHAVLETLGSPVRYEELMVASGAAFATAWAPRTYSYNARCATPEDLVVNGAAAAGAQAERRSFRTPEEAWVAVCESIDEGRPVIASNDSAANIICGYDPDARKMHLNRYDVGETEYEVLPFELHSGPTGAANEVIFVELDAGAEPPDLDWPAVILRAVQFADWPAEQKVHQHFAFGLSAYDAWAATLRSVGDRDGSRQTQTLARVVESARRAASTILSEHATIHDGFADAAYHYGAEADILGAMRTVLAQGQIATWAASFEAMSRNFPDPGVREQAAQLIELAKEEDLLAVEALRIVLEDLAPGRQPQKVEPPEPPEVVSTNSEAAQQHYAEGLRLKQAGRWQEAATHLRAAIEADPNHVDAHWALAWVLIELKDPKQAAGEFRKVIELAPGSERAAEAEKALGRLQQ